MNPLRSLSNVHLKLHWDCHCDRLPERILQHQHFRHLSWWYNLWTKPQWTGDGNQFICPVSCSILFEYIGLKDSSSYPRFTIGEVALEKYLQIRTWKPLYPVLLHKNTLHSRTSKAGGRKKNPINYSNSCHTYQHHCLNLIRTNSAVFLLLTCPLNW